MGEASLDLEPDKSSKSRNPEGTGVQAAGPGGDQGWEGVTGWGERPHGQEPGFWYPRGGAAGTRLCSARTGSEGVGRNGRHMALS